MSIHGVIRFHRGIVDHAGGGCRQATRQRIPGLIFRS